MTFLQPFILFALPLIALPILIHLINQQRYKTIPWAATMFLLQAKRMAKGMARLKYILILIARMLAVAGLLFALSRPMATGWSFFGGGSQPETTIVILDRSASMEQQSTQGSPSKRLTSLQKVADMVNTSGRNTELILIDSATAKPLKLDSAENLLDLPQTVATATAADIPALIESAVEYITVNQLGRTDVWICSDLRNNDWSPSSGRWEAIRTQLAERQGVRFYLLTYPTIPENNLAISVTKVERVLTPTTSELRLDMEVTRSKSSDESIKVPMNLVINGARSTIDIELTGARTLIAGQAIPLDRESTRGWGYVELPRDQNVTDDVSHFVYSEPAARKTTIVAESSDIGSLIKLAMETPSQRGISFTTEVLRPSEAAAIDFGASACLIWQGPLPTGQTAQQIESFLAMGRSVFFFPPDSPDDSSLLGLSWKQWEETDANAPLNIKNWKIENDLFANTQSNAPLPVGDITAYRYCPYDVKSAVTLASLDGNVPLVSRITTNQGAAYICATLPRLADSTLARNGIVFYIMMHRVLDQGAATLQAARSLTCGTISEDATTNWKPTDSYAEAVMPSQRPYEAGLYQSDDRYVGLTRPSAEDDLSVVAKETLDESMSGLDFTLIDDQAGSNFALASEVWRFFLIIMVIALVVECILCIPDKVPVSMQFPQVRTPERPAA